MTFKAQIMNAEDMRRAIVRISHQIVEKNHGTDDVCIIGIKTRGIPFAKRLSEYIGTVQGTAPQVGELDISLYRDDLELIAPDPVTGPSSVPFSVAGKTVILADDVIYTGRTARAAIDAVFALGRPARIQLAALVDRGHRELPIKADYIGKNIPSSHKELIKVSFVESDGEDSVALFEKD